MSDVEKANAALMKKMGQPKPGRQASLKEKVRELAPSIKMALDNGYSIDEIADLLKADGGIDVKAKTLKDYYYQVRGSSKSTKKTKTKSKTDSSASPAPAPAPTPSPTSVSPEPEVHFAWGSEPVQIDPSMIDMQKLAELMNGKG